MSKGDRSAIVAACAIAIAMAGSMLHAQVQLLPTSPRAKFSVTKAESHQVAELWCETLTGKPKVPIWMRWLDFRTLQIRKGTTAGYQTFGQFDKVGYNVTGDYIEALPSLSNEPRKVVITIRYNDGKTLVGRMFTTSIAATCD